MKIVTAQQLDTKTILGIIPDAKVVSVKSQEELLRESLDTEIVFGVSSTVFRTLLLESRTLRWAHTSTAGADHYISKELQESSVILTCAKGGPAGRNLAEHALGLALALSRNIGEAARSKHWRRRDLSPGAFELSGRTAGIAGFGAAGHDMVQLLSGFNMAVYAIKRTPPFDSSRRLQVLSPRQFDTMCTKSDVIFNFLPETAETYRIFSRKAFGTMKASALFVNVGRGSTVDTEALVAALQSGSIAGAGLDTVDPEPLPENHPLWSMSNVVISPHIAGSSPERVERNKQLFLENLKRYSDGKPLLNVVNPEAGY